MKFGLLMKLNEFNLAFENFGKSLIFKINKQINGLHVGMLPFSKTRSYMVHVLKIITRKILNDQTIKSSIYNKWRAAACSY